jgi:predicted MFS family arabinose efflux permease
MTGNILETTEFDGSADGTAWRVITSAFCATFVGLGLARFAYTPLLPALIDARWFSASDAAYLGAANLAGYLAGAAIARMMAIRFTSASTLRMMMALATCSFFSCAVPLSFAWFFVWRFASGVAGGVLMVLAATNALPTIAAKLRGIASGIIFSGIGIGVILSGTIVPILLQLGLRETWLTFGAISMALTATTWFWWPIGRIAPTVAVSIPDSSRTIHLRTLYAEYALMAAGIVPLMVFLVDFVARGLHKGIETGSGYWILFGLGAAAGPILAGWAADSFGFKASLRIALAVEAFAAALLIFNNSTAALTITSILIGSSAPINVTLVLGRVRELAPSGRENSAWSTATIIFSIAQTFAAYLDSYIFASTGERYEYIFAIGSAAFAAAFALEVISELVMPQPARALIRNRQDR